MLEKELIEEYELIRDQEATYWQQKSRDKWLKGGHRNTKYFHLTTLVRRRNKIENLADDNGVLHSDDATMRNIVVSFFEDLFAHNPREDTGFIIPYLFPPIN